MLVNTPIMNWNPFWYDRPLVFLETSKGGVKTISAPHMIAKMLYHLELAPGQEVLILGAKGGYIAALIAHIVGPEGGVVVVDPSREVVDHVRERISTVTNTCCSCQKNAATDTLSPQLPEPLDRVLVTGSLESLPNWLESRIVDGDLSSPQLVVAFLNILSNANELSLKVGWTPILVVFCSGLLILQIQNPNLCQQKHSLNCFEKEPYWVMKLACSTMKYCDESSFSIT